MQDSTPCQRSKLMVDFVKKKNIKTLDRPDNSPDFNSIENFWAILKEKVADLEMAIKCI